MSSQIISKQANKMDDYEDDYDEEEEESVVELSIQEKRDAAIRRNEEFCQAIDEQYGDVLKTRVGKQKRNRSVSAAKRIEAPIIPTAARRSQTHQPNKVNKKLILTICPYCQWNQMHDPAKSQVKILGGHWGQDLECQRKRKEDYERNRLHRKDFTEQEEGTNFW